MRGLLLLNKPSGITSFGAVARIRRLANEKRVGHTGTLDPMATGVLPILLGRATALSGLILEKDKRYTATVRLGLTTDTEDITGRVLSESAVAVTQEQVRQILTRFCGTIKQKPPMFSAIKKDGVRLYELARKGESMDLPEREVTVFSAELTDFSEAEHTFCASFHVSSGTYIRSLARDIGEALGCGACLESLCRTATAGFSLENCVSLETLAQEGVEPYLLSEEAAVSALREIRVTEKQAIRFCNGGALAFDRLPQVDFSENERFRVKRNERFLGIGRANIEKEQLEIQCIINDAREAEC